jgi:hypothetical protein
VAVNQEAAIPSITGTPQYVRDGEVIVTETDHFFNGRTSSNDKHKPMGSEGSDRGKQTQQNAQHLPDNAAFYGAHRVFFWESGARNHIGRP